MKEILKKALRFALYNASSRHIWLCSWPRSGNTLLRHLLLSGYGFSENEFSYFCKDIHNTRIFYSKRSICLQNHYFYKSHYSYHPKIKKCVLLIRNPVEASVSWAIYQLNTCDYSNSNYNRIVDLSLNLALNSIYGSWEGNTVSYVNKCQKLLIIKYEELVIDKQKKLKKIFNFLDLNDNNFNYNVIDRFNTIKVAQNKGCPSDIQSGVTSNSILKENFKKEVCSRVMKSEKIRRALEFYQSF